MPANNGFDLGTRSFGIGKVNVVAENNRGHSPEFWADRIANRVCGISSDAPPHVRQQAEAFREQVRDIALKCIMGALRSDRQTMAGEIRESYPEIARQILAFRVR